MASNCNNMFYSLMSDAEFKLNLDGMAFANYSGMRADFSNFLILNG